MAYLVLEINLTGLQIEDLNDRCLEGGNKQNASNGAIDLIAAIASGAQSGTIKLVSKDVATTINTSGSGSTSVTY